MLATSRTIDRTCRRSSTARAILQNHRSWLAPTENWIYNQIRNLPPTFRSAVVCATIRDKSEFQWPTIFCLKDMTALERVRVFSTGIFKLRRDFRRHAALLNWASKRIGAELVHSHFGFTGASYAAAVRKMGLKHVVTFYGVDVSMLPRVHAEWRSRYTDMFPLVDRVLCEGPFMAEAVADLGCPKEKITVHHLGVELGELPFRPRQWTPEQPLRVLIAASFREKKGIPYALEALARLRKDQELSITILGDGSNNPASVAEKAKILSTIDRLGIGDVTVLRGFQPHPVLIETAYRNHIFLSPSVTASDGDTEGGAPVAITEMAATGMPIVASRHADIPNVIRDGIDGFLADERDVGGLVSSLRMWINSAGAWDKPLTNARRRIESEFNAVKQGERLSDIYRAVIDG